MTDFNPRKPDYNYETWPADLDCFIELKGGIARFLTFAQTNQIEFYCGPDGMHGLYINGSGVWGCEMDYVSALFYGISSYWDHPEKH